MTVVWLSLVLSLALVFAASIVATSRAVRLFRDVKRLGGAVGRELERIAVAAGHIEGHIGAAGRSAESLSASLARLTHSRARLDVLLAAIADVRASVAPVTAFLPRR